jgi:hypothetical protein
MLRRTMFAPAVLFGTKRRVRRLTKFAGKLSGTRHFNVPLYPIEDHLAQPARAWMDSDGDRRQGVALSRIGFGIKAAKAGARERCVP